jgi:hypothetical protein
MNRRNNNNNNRRRFNNNNRRANNNARPASAKVTRQDANRQTTRTLNRITNINLNTIGPNGGTLSYSTILNPLSAFAGANTLLQQYEQFRIDRIRVYARTDSSNVLGVNPVGRLLATYSLAESSTLATVIDDDSFSAPTESSFLGRDAMKIRSLSPGTFKLIGNYSPRCRLSDASNDLPALVPHQSTTWISTEFADLDWLGLNIRATQDSPIWGVDTNNCAKVQLFIKASVQFRGLKKDQTQLISIPSIDVDPTILTQTTYPNSIKSSADLVSNAIKDVDGT